MKNLSQKIIEKIKQERIEPTPKWEFVMKDTFFWIGFVISILIGGLSFSIIFNTLLNNDWDLYIQLAGGLTKFVIITLPYFWLIIFTLFVIVAYLNIHKTKKAYKYSLQMIIGGVLLASFLLGITFYNLGLASSINRGFSDMMPRYHKMLNPGENLWSKPEGGFLSGTVDYLDGNVLRLIDLDGQIWEITLSENILEIVPNFILEKDFKIKITGEEITDNCMNKCFYAEMLRPFDGPRMMLENEFLDKETLEKMNLHMREIRPMLEGRIHKNIKVLKQETKS